MAVAVFVISPSIAIVVATLVLPAWLASGRNTTTFPCRNTRPLARKASMIRWSVSVASPMNCPDAVTCESMSGRLRPRPSMQIAARAIRRSRRIQLWAPRLLNSAKLTMA